MRRAMVKLATVLMAMLVLALPLAADEILLHDGKVVVGRIVQNTSAFVTIETMVHGRPATLTFRRAQIRSVTRGEVPDSFFEVAEAPVPAAPDPRQTPTPTEGAGGIDEGAASAADEPGGPAVVRERGDGVRYMAVPLKGGVGQEITARGVRDAIRLAKRHRVDAVVFVIETDGGRVADADAIARVMDEERGDLKYYSVVTKAISAGIWPLSRSDQIFFEPGAIAGAATAYSSSSGRVEVDAKFNAAVAGQLASAAEAREQFAGAGGVGDIYRAMVVMDASLYRWRDADGRIRLSGVRPAQVGEAVVQAEEIVTRGQVLALTTREAAEIGFAREIPANDLAAIGRLIGAPNWEAIGTTGGGAMVAAAREVARRVTARENAERRIDETRLRIVELAEQTPRLLQAAAAADPSRIRVYYREGTGTLTAESQMRWRQATDEALSRWSDFQSLLERIRSAERAAARAVDDYNSSRAREWEARLYDEAPEAVVLPSINHGLDLDRLHREAEEKKSQLQSRRMRGNVGR